MRILLLIGCSLLLFSADLNARSPAASAETRPPNAEGQKPAFPNQTRAPIPSETESWELNTIASGLDHPWAVTQLPDGSFLVTEKPGHLRLVTAEGAISEPIGGVPDVHARSQGGLLDVALDPNFSNNDQIYLTFAESRGDGESGTTAIRARLDRNRLNLTDASIIFRMQPAWDSRGHYGSRIVFADDHTLFITLGDRMNSEPRQRAQSKADHLGAVVRIHSDGGVPEDNPYVGDPDAAPEIWSYGHRNLQAAALHPGSGELWTIEHGPRGGDELNQPEAGKNYGWPVISYGVNYNGQPIGQGITKKKGLEQPVYYWDPVIAPSGMMFYTGDQFPAWRGNLFVGGLASNKLVRLVLEDGQVTGEEWLEMPGRIRDVHPAADGSILMVTDEGNGRLLRLSNPAAPPSGRATMTAKLIQSIEGFDGPEAVKHDPLQDLYFVSNFTGDPGEPDADGYISRVSPDGQILDLKFMQATGSTPFHAGRGMALQDNKLWVADRDGLHAFDRSSGAHQQFVDFTSHQPGFLNDITVNADGDLFVTDTGAGRIYAVRNGETSVALSDIDPGPPNGIFYDESRDRYLLAPWGGEQTLRAWLPASGELTEWGTSEGGYFDGLEQVDGQMIVASQADQTLRLIGNGLDQVLAKLDGRPADIGYDSKRNRIIVPYVSLDRIDVFQLSRPE